MSCTKQPPFCFKSRHAMTAQTFFFASFAKYCILFLPIAWSWQLESLYLLGTHCDTFITGYFSVLEHWLHHRINLSHKVPATFQSVNIALFPFASIIPSQICSISPSALDIMRIKVFAWKHSWKDFASAPEAINVKQQAKKWWIYRRLFTQVLIEV